MNRHETPLFTTKRLAYGRGLIHAIKPRRRRFAIFRYTIALRRILSLVLLLAFGLPLAAPAFGLAADAETSLPACCRRAGAHHCVMTAEQAEALLNGNHITTVRSKCPFCPTTSPASQHTQLGFHTANTQQSGLVSYPTRYGQIEAWARATEIGVRQNRGPPQHLL